MTVKYRTGQSGWLRNPLSLYLLSYHVGHDAFDGRDDELVLDFGLQLLQVRLEIGRRSDEYQRIGSLHYIVDVGAEIDTLGVEFDARQIGGVMAQPFEVGNAVVAPHVPIDRLGLVEHHFGNGSRPTTSAHDGYLSGNFHFCSVSSSLFLSIRPRR